jgi:hypothetical protein
MKSRLSLTFAVAALVASLAGATMAPAAGAAKTQQPAAAANTVTGLTQHLTGTATGTTGNPQAFDLTATITKFVNQNGQLLATGTVTGTLTDTVTNAVQTVNQTFAVPITSAAAAASCTILDLVLGPLHLNLLGLVVDLNQVHLTITGQRGPGNLLGNLLCGVADLLNGTGGAGGIAGLLNRLLGLLG